MVSISVGNPIGNSVQGTEISIPSEADGDILIRNTNWGRLAKGSDGQFLKIASGLPSWGGGGALTLIDSASPSGAANVDFTSITAGKAFLVIFRLVTTQASTNLNLTLNGVTGTAYRNTTITGAGTTGETSGAANYKLADISNSEVFGWAVIGGSCEGTNNIIGIVSGAHDGGGSRVTSLFGRCQPGSSQDVSQITLQTAAGTITGEVELYEFST